MFVDKARSVFVGSAEEMMDVVMTGSENRRQAATGMNADSSRSHSVLMVTVTQRDPVKESVKQGRLVLVDLAGSESVGKTGAVGEQLQEAKMINKSLTTLNLVRRRRVKSRLVGRSGACRVLVVLQHTVQD